ncbi:MAG: SDR family oxidoreductase [Chloroflexi bacterium]|nr:SDR family oxidoreductase [Chloroflexota bacterium]
MEASFKEQFDEAKRLYQTIQPRYAELAGQVAIVTGSGRGIGRGIAFRLAKEGMKVVITGLDAEEVTTTSAILTELGATTLALPGDLSQTGEVDRLFDRTLETFGSLNALVNNAAHLGRVPYFEAGEELLDLQLATNIKNPYMCSYRAAKIMHEAGQGGNIVQISSVAGARAQWPGLPYDLTKAAIDAITRSMGVELAEHGIRVNAVAPGAIRVEKTPAEDAPGTQARIHRIPMKRLGQPLDIAAAVAFLISNEAAYITGHVMYVDGGIVAQLSPRGQDI